MVRYCDVFLEVYPEKRFVAGGLFSEDVPRCFVMGG